MNRTEAETELSRQWDVIQSAWSRICDIRTACPDAAMGWSFWFNVKLLATRMYVEAGGKKRDLERIDHDAA